VVPVEGRGRKGRLQYIDCHCGWVLIAEAENEFRPIVELAEEAGKKKMAALNKRLQEIKRSNILGAD
jgi:hypothetical protein